MPTLTIDFTADQTQRISEAFQTMLELPDPATEADIKAWIIDNLKSIVRSVERTAADKVHTTGSVDVVIT